MPAKRNANGETKKKLEAVGEDALIAKIADGMSNKQIAEELGVSTPSVTQWFNAEPNRSARAKDARRESAQAEDDMALEAIARLGEDSKPGDIARAREEAQHRRWRAKSRDPERYGDKVALNHGVQGDTASLMGELAALFGIKKTEEE